MRRIATLLCLFIISSLSAQTPFLTRFRPERIQSTWRIPERRPEQIRLLFTGDVMQHLPQVNAARQKDGKFNYSPVFEEVKSLFDSADLVVVNLETTLTRRQDYSGYPCFRSPAAFADALHDAGVDVAIRANNHCCDNGAEGIRTTGEELKRVGIRCTGVFADSTEYKANNILYLKSGLMSLALLNYTYSTNGMPVPKGMIVNTIDTVRMARDLTEAQASGVDFIVVCMHWGVEYQRQENREQRSLADFLHRHGVNVVIGSHPHVVQPWVCNGNHVVVYSLGNFVSNQRMPYTDQGLMAEVVAEKQSDGEMHYRLRLFATQVERNYKVKVRGEL